MIKIQIEEIENRELELEAQREELATELEKCQLLGESLHKIQADIRGKSILVNEREKNVKILEEKLNIRKNELEETQMNLNNHEGDLLIKEGQMVEIIEDIEQKQIDILKTSKMFEEINQNLIEKSLKLDADTEYLNKKLFEIDKKKIMNDRKSQRLEN